MLRVEAVELAVDTLSSVLNDDALSIIITLLGILRFSLPCNCHFF